MSYDDLLIEADNHSITTKEAILQSGDGFCNGNRIAIRKDIPTTTEKACVLAEELGHYHTSTGNILDQSSVVNRKQEQKARLWGYNKMIGMYGLISAVKAGRRNAYEVAEYLGVSEEFLKEAITLYKSKYGFGKHMDNYWIMFEPTLQVYELYELE